MICTSCCKLDEFTSLIQLCLRILESASFSCMNLSSESFALAWGWRSLSAGSSGAILSHSPPFVWALPPTWPIVHGWSTDNQGQKPQFAVRSPLYFFFALMVSKPWVIFQMLMCYITSLHVFGVVPPSPSAACLAGMSAISHCVLGHWAPWGKELGFCTTSERGSRAPSQAAGLCVGSVHTPVSALSVCGPGDGGRVSVLVLASISRISLFNISFCSDFF